MDCAMNDNKRRKFSINIFYFFFYIYIYRQERERESERLVKDLKWVEEFSETIVEILSEKFAS